MLHGNRTYLLQDEDGQILEAHSISAGLDYPGIGPEHSWLRDTGRVNYVAATDQEALDAFQLCTRLEGIIPALEPSHALAYVEKLAPSLPPDNLLVMNMSGAAIRISSPLPATWNGNLSWRRAQAALGNVNDFDGSDSANFCELAGGGEEGACDLCHGGRSRLRNLAGDPERAAKAGADIIELGMPFSDPMADGPAIQRASQRALRGGQTMNKTLEMVRRFRETIKTRRSF